MNERIRPLLNVCGMPNEQLMEIYNDQNQTFYMEQFALLIVKECCTVADKTQLVDRQLAVSYALKEYFGVKL